MAQHHQHVDPRRLDVAQHLHHPPDGGAAGPLHRDHHIVAVGDPLGPLERTAPAAPWDRTGSASGSPARRSPACPPASRSAEPRILITVASGSRSSHARSLPSGRPARGRRPGARLRLRLRTKKAGSSPHARAGSARPPPPAAPPGPPPSPCGAGANQRPSISTARPSASRRARARVQLLRARVDLLARSSPSSTPSRPGLVETGGRSPAAGAPRLRRMKSTLTCLSYLPRINRAAKVAELVDAQDSGSCGRKAVGVRVPPFAPSLFLPSPAEATTEQAPALARPGARRAPPGFRCKF